MDGFSEKQAMLDDLDAVIASHRQIVQYDRLLQEQLERLRGTIARATDETDKQEWREEMGRIIQLVKDLAIEEQRLIEESPAPGNPALEEEVHSYFKLSDQLRGLAERHFKTGCIAT